MQVNDTGSDLKIPLQMLLRFQSIYGSLKRAERSAADLLMERPGFVANASIAVAAGMVGVSQPTFVRLAKHLGYSGFSEMKEVLLQGDSDNTTLPQMPYGHITPESKPYEIAQSVVYASIEALNGLMKVMNPQDYENAANALLKAERIVFLGAGDSGIVASSAFQKFLRVGAVCHTAADSDTQMMLAALLNERCVCLLISHSGNTASIVQAAKLAKAAGATTIAVTNFPYSHLAKTCSIILLTATFVQRGGEVVTQRIAQLAIIESLFITYRLRGGTACDEAYARTNQVFNDTNKL